MDLLFLSQFSMAVEEPRNFKLYLYLPEELRVMVIDEMRTNDRCRFTRCSKLSRKEAQSSKKYVHGLMISRDSYGTTLNVFYSEFDPIKNQNHGYILTFTNHGGFKLMRYLNLKQQELWKIDLPDSKNVVKFASQNFKNLLKNYHDKIKQLEVYTTEIVDLEVRSFRRLESVGAQQDMLISQIFPKLRLPLKILESYKNEHNSLASCEEVYQVQNYIRSYTTGFNNEQFLRLRASQLSIHIGELSVENVYNFIRSWQNGKVRENFDYCEWDLEDSNFNIKQLFGLFGVDFGTEDISKVEFDNHRDPAKTASLISHEGRDQIMFMTKNRT